MNARTKSILVNVIVAILTAVLSVLTGLQQTLSPTTQAGTECPPCVCPPSECPLCGGFVPPPLQEPDTK